MNGYWCRSSDFYFLLARGEKKPIAVNGKCMSCLVRPIMPHLILIRPSSKFDPLKLATISFDFYYCYVNVMFIYQSLQLMSIFPTALTVICASFSAVFFFFSSELFFSFSLLLIVLNKRLISICGDIHAIKDLFIFHNANDSPNGNKFLVIN